MQKENSQKIFINRIFYDSCKSIQCALIKKYKFALAFDKVYFTTQGKCKVTHVLSTTVSHLNLAPIFFDFLLKS